jgi:hypothetical protein
VLRDIGLQHEVTSMVFLDLARHVQNSWLDANDTDLAAVQHKMLQRQQQQQQGGHAVLSAAQDKALAAGKVLAEYLANNYSRLLSSESQQQLRALMFVPATLGVPGGCYHPATMAYAGMAAPLTAVVGVAATCLQV